MPDTNDSAQVAEEPQTAPVEVTVEVTEPDEAPEVPEWVSDPVAAYKAVQAARREAAEARTKLKTEQDAAAKDAEERRQARLTAIEKADDARKKAEARADAAEQRVVAAERRALLTGKVVDLDAALELIKPEHLSTDGSLDVDAFLEARAFLKVPEPDPEPSGPRLSGMNGRSVHAPDKSALNDAIRRAGRR